MTATEAPPAWKGWVREHGLSVLGLGLGAGLGALYALKVGCLTGGCPITSNPWLTALFGGLIGYSLLKDVRLGRRPAGAEEGAAGPGPGPGEGA